MEMKNKRFGCLPVGFPALILKSELVLLCECKRMREMALMFGVKTEKTGWMICVA